MPVIVALAVALASASLGGGLYEFTAVDPSWPKRPDLVQPAVGKCLLAALASHAIMRLWSGFDFIPKALAFEKADPATVSEAAALAWTRRSRLRLPLDLITCGALLTAFAAAARLG